MSQATKATFTLAPTSSDCEDEYSDETFGEFCDANTMEFYEDGRRVKQ